MWNSILGQCWERGSAANFQSRLRLESLVVSLAAAFCRINPTFSAAHSHLHFPQHLIVREPKLVRTFPIKNTSGRNPTSIRIIKPAACTVRSPSSRHLAFDDLTVIKGQGRVKADRVGIRIFHGIITAGTSAVGEC